MKSTESNYVHLKPTLSKKPLILLAILICVIVARAYWKSTHCAHCQQKQGNESVEIGK